MKWLQNIILFFGTILIYLHIYIHFKISALNEFTDINDICKEKIMSSIYFKLPFVFDGTTILKPINEKKEKDRRKIYKKSYEKLPMLEPSVRFFTNDTIYELKKGKHIDIHRNLECRNFYMVHSGKVIVYCIHPKYKDNLNLDKSKTNEVKNIDFIENNAEILRVELYPNSILFVPNYWFIYVKSLEKGIVEKVQYKTILNQVNFIHDNYLNNNLIYGK
jgi:Fe-S-cluster formation regulator IscX/YfhJ